MERKVQKSKSNDNISFYPELQMVTYISSRNYIEAADQKRKWVSFRIFSLNNNYIEYMQAQHILSQLPKQQLEMESKEGLLQIVSQQIIDYKIKNSYEYNQKKLIESDKLIQQLQTKLKDGINMLRQEEAKEDANPHIELQESQVQISIDIDFDKLDNQNVCQICFNSFNQCKSIVIDQQCGHQFCFECIQNYLQGEINNGRVLRIKCPEDNCNVMISDEQIKIFTSFQLFEKYEKFKHDQEISNDPKIRWCTRPGCNTFIRQNNEEVKLVCPKCEQAICFSCSLNWHQGDCQQAIEMIYKNACKNYAIKLCPQCNSPIQKNEGCNHMTCWKCQHEFCWLCLKDYTSEHYNITNFNGCPGGQYSQRQPGFGSKTCNILIFCLQIILMALLWIIGVLIGLALYLALSPLTGLIIETIFYYDRAKRYSNINCISWFLIYLIILPIIVALSPLVGIFVPLILMICK